jgi:hypothetical protein
MTAPSSGSEELFVSIIVRLDSFLEGRGGGRVFVARPRAQPSPARSGDLHGGEPGVHICDGAGDLRRGSAVLVERAARE